MYFKHKKQSQNVNDRFDRNYNGWKIYFFCILIGFIYFIPNGWDNNLIKSPVSYKSAPRRSLRTFGNSSNLTLSTFLCISRLIGRTQFLNLKKYVCPNSMICELRHALYTTSNCIHFSSYFHCWYWTIQKHKLMFSCNKPKKLSCLDTCSFQKWTTVFLYRTISVNNCDIENNHNSHCWWKMWHWNIIPICQYSLILRPSPVDVASCLLLVIISFSLVFFWSWKYWSSVITCIAVTTAINMTRCMKGGVSL